MSPNPQPYRLRGGGKGFFFVCTMCNRVRTMHVRLVWCDDGIPGSGMQTECVSKWHSNVDKDDAKSGRERQVGNPGQDERDSGMIPNGVPG